MCFLLCFFNDTATTEIYTLSLHDALPICEAVEVVLLGDDRLPGRLPEPLEVRLQVRVVEHPGDGVGAEPEQPEREPEIGRHTSELQSRQYLVCRLLLEKKKNRRHSRPRGR